MSMDARSSRQLSAKSVLTLTDIASLREARAQWRAQGERTALVPTMGNLHRGHLRLVEAAQTQAARVVVSVFVNPMQFDRADDLAAYPRTLEDDGRKLREVGADLLFAPEMAVIFPNGHAHTTWVEVPGLSDVLEGASRPGHFRGVATVVTKLFNMVQPDVAVFGGKDYQQLLVIRRLTADLNLPIGIAGVATEREPDGLAMSSRNGYLSGDERRQAPGLYRVLRELADLIRGGAGEYPALERQAVSRLKTLRFKPDYISVRRQQDLAPPAPQDGALVVLGAAWLGKARLIDNVSLDLNPPA